MKSSLVLELKNMIKSHLMILIYHNLWNFVQWN